MPILNNDNLDLSSSSSVMPTLFPFSNSDNNSKSTGTVNINRSAPPNLTPNFPTVPIFPPPNCSQNCPVVDSRDGEASSELNTPPLPLRHSVRVKQKLRAGFATRPKSRSLTYEKVIEDDLEIINPQIQKMCEDKNSRTDIKKAILAQAEKNTKELEHEVAFMRKVQLSAGQYLRQHSIAQASDGYLDRLEPLQEEELKNEEKETLQRLGSEGSSGKGSISVETVKDLLNQLYKLPRQGSAIKELLEKRMSTGSVVVDEIYHSPSLRRYHLAEKKITKLPDLVKLTLKK
ncbi:hypothetical protein Fcan01_11341 [Folsomia candida]|uniref:Uncharacterized protein n=1 Tax=Folsomia candida TaxID=158441 RepID=A0A226EEG3_FOLCA|nr:hypothetical protein Fcan01_11341 [Folsomia candida]